MQGIKNPSMTKTGGYNCTCLYELILTLRREWDSEECIRCVVCSTWRV